MSGVSGVGRMTAGGAGRARTGPAAGGFSLASVAPSAAGAAAPAAAVALGSMLALQEAGGEPVRDRAARRHGHAMLQLLAALQRAMLGGGSGDDTELGRLAALSADIPAASDPGLRQAVAAIALRASIELARRRTVIPRNGFTRASLNVSARALGAIVLRRYKPARHDPAPARGHRSPGTQVGLRTRKQDRRA